MAVEQMVEVKVIEWPEKGSAKRWPHGGWYVVEERPGRGFTPLLGPLRTEKEGQAALAAWKESRR